MMHDGFEIYAIGPIHMRILGLILIVPFWQLFSKVGYSSWWSLLMIVPIVNLITPTCLLFWSWPSLKR